MGLGPRIERMAYRDTDVTVFGDVHTAEGLDVSRDDIAQEMARHDAFAWEARGYRPDTWLTEMDDHVYDGLVAANETLRELDMNSFDRYAAAVDEMALDHFDEAWGPDSHHAFPYAAGLLGPVLMAGGTGYTAAAAVDIDPDLRTAVREDVRDLTRMARGREHGWGERNAELSMTRRQMVVAGGMLGLGGALGWTGGAFPDAPGIDLPDDWTYTDMRDVFTTTGVDRVVDAAAPDSLLVLVGTAHVDGITRYLDDPDGRARRMDRYGPVLDAVLESDTRMARWQDAGGYWDRADVVDLHP